MSAQSFSVVEWKSKQACSRGLYGDFVTKMSHTGHHSVHVSNKKVNVMWLVLCVYYFGAVMLL